ncbi:MAG TPA: YbjN domain-containing protein, partial [Chitinophagaceae bacterium]|nr:YbjN domain-containing protein [Chitinophagaceae bacterium]
MTTVDTVTGYILRLCVEMNIDPQTIFNKKTGAWYFAQGSSTIEVFLTTQKNLQHQPQTFIRCMAALCEIPKDITKQFSLYKTALAINATYLGYKISADEARGLVCIISERNIEGMDFEEMVILINDLGTWAAKL